MHCITWLGPIPLSRAAIQAAIPIASPAVIMLGSLDSHGAFVPERLVRSEHDLIAEIERFTGQYSHCQISPCKTPAIAYILECELFHRFRPRGIHYHPGQPDGLNVVCPFCGFSSIPREVA